MIIREELDELVQHPLVETLGTKLSEVLPELFHANEIEKKAIRLINHPSAISIVPTLETNEVKKVFLVQGRLG